MAFWPSTVEIFKEASEPIGARWYAMKARLARIRFGCHEIPKG
jgi:hypothetical protein